MEPALVTPRKTHLVSAAAWAALAICATVVLAWITGSPTITRAVPELPTMKFNGALCFGLLALSVIAGGDRVSPRVLPLLGAAVLIGIATGLQYPIGLDLGIDQWLVADPDSRGPHPGRMALSTLVCLLGLAAALALRIVRPARSEALARLLTSIVMVVAYVGSMGLLTQTRWEGWLEPVFGSFSVPVSAVILLLAIAVSNAGQPRHERPSVADAGMAGAVYARVALPIGLLIPVAVAWTTSLVSGPLGTAGHASSALVLALSGTLFALLVLSSAAWIARLERTLLDERRSLERMVDLRTSQYQQTELREKRARLQLDMIVNSVDVAIAAVDGQGHLLLFNAAAERLFGRQRSALLGRPLEELLPAQTRVAHREWVQAFAGTAGAARRMGGDRQVTGLRADGTAFPMEATISTSQSEPVLMTVVIRDLTVAHQLEAERLARSQIEADHRARWDLLQQINHEFRTPLNAVLGCAQLLGLQPELQRSDQSRRYVQLIQDAGQALLTQVQDLTRLGQPETEPARLDLQAVNLRPVVRSCLDLQRQSALAARLDWPLELDCSHDLAVMADESRLRQILTNLLRNAIKYNRPGGHVRVAGRPTADTRRVELEVSDSGIGMTDDQVAAAFEPYNRAGREHSRIEGSGLGLPIARRLAEAMQGTLIARSQPGVGSTFTLTLPAP